MEEQRNLTGRAQDMDGELRKARLIEDQEIPVGVVAPGTRVTFQVMGSSEHQSWSVLGPWDAIEDDIVSYRAPLAKDLLGRKVGDKAQIQDPRGPRDIRIEKIERLV